MRYKQNVIEILGAVTFRVVRKTRFSGENSEFDG